MYNPKQNMNVRLCLIVRVLFSCEDTQYNFAAYSIFLNLHFQSTRISLVIIFGLRSCMFPGQPCK